MIGFYKITEPTIRDSVADTLQLPFTLDQREMWVCPFYGFIVTSVRRLLNNNDLCLFLDHIEGHRLVCRRSLAMVEEIAMKSGCKWIVCTPINTILGELYRRKGFEWIDDTYMRKAVSWADHQAANPVANKPLQPTLQPASTILD